MIWTAQSLISFNILETFLQFEYKNFITFNFTGSWNFQLLQQRKAKNLRKNELWSLFMTTEKAWKWGLTQGLTCSVKFFFPSRPLTLPTIVLLRIENVRVWWRHPQKFESNCVRARTHLKIDEKKILNDLKILPNEILLR